jgi:hypothetical protein
MNKEERENGITAAVHHYAHLAAHSESKQGTREYDRSDAKMMVALVATLVSHRFSG